MRYTILSICLSFCSTLSMGQSMDLFQELKARYPEEPAVFIERSSVLNIDVEGDSLRVFNEVFEDMLHLKEHTDVFSSKKVYGSHFSEVVDLQAKTLVWTKNKYKEIDISVFKKNGSLGQSIFFDDSYYYTFDFPSLAAQNRTQVRYKELYRDSRFFPGHFFASYLPQANTSFSIKTSKAVELIFEVINDPKKTISFTKTEKGKTVIYEWRAKNMEAMKAEESSPSVSYFSPHLIVYIKSYQGKTKKIDVLPNLDALYQWYQTFTKGLNTETSPALQAVVDTLRSKSKSELELVKNIFYWVQDNIQYIAFEQGMRGFIPNHASYICEKRYGDCKDMANLIVGMLHIAGVNASHTWIGSRDLPYKYTEVPTPIVDNHMIATYISKDGQYYFLDATSDYCPMGYPSSMIQGKEALIAISPTKYEVKVVPVIEKEKNLMTDSMTIKLDNNQIIGSGKSTLDGFAKVFGSYHLDRAEQDDVKKYVTSLIGKGNNKFYLDHYNVSDLANPDKQTHISYDFRISDYFQKISDELYINLNLNKDYYNAFINIETRKTPKELDYKYLKYEYIELAIPQGYRVEYIPENASHQGKLLGYDISYHVKTDKIIFSKKFYVDYLLMEPSQFEIWNEDVKRISEVYKESIIFKKK